MLSSSKMLFFIPLALAVIAGAFPLQNSDTFSCVLSVSVSALSLSSSTSKAKKNDDDAKPKQFSFKSLFGRGQSKKKQENKEQNHQTQTQTGQITQGQHQHSQQNAAGSTCASAFGSNSQESAKPGDELEGSESDSDSDSDDEYVDPATSMILLGGGVGPAAGVALHQKIVDITNAKSDKDHLKVCHVSFSSLIRDRTAFLKEKKELSLKYNKQRQEQDNDMMMTVTQEEKAELRKMRANMIVARKRQSQCKCETNAKSSTNSKANDGQQQQFDEHCHFDLDGALGVVHDLEEKYGQAKDQKGYKIRNPGQDMADVLSPFIEVAEEEGLHVIIGVPCNTFHAPACYDVYKQGLEHCSDDFTACHMLNETRDFLKEMQHEDPSLKKIGLVSTTGTRGTRIYRELLEPIGFEVLEVKEEHQAEVHDTIYNQEWGLKAVSPATEKAIANYEKFAHELLDAGAQVIILGCTEIPLAFKRCKEGKFPPTQDLAKGKGKQQQTEKQQHQAILVDPVLCLARAMVHEAAPQKLKKLRRVKANDGATELQLRPDKDGKLKEAKNKRESYIVDKEGSITIVPTGAHRQKVLAEAPKHNKHFELRMSKIHAHAEDVGAAVGAYATAMGPHMMFYPPGLGFYHVYNQTHNMNY